MTGCFYVTLHIFFAPASVQHFPSCLGIKYSGKVLSGFAIPVPPQSTFVAVKQLALFQIQNEVLFYFQSPVIPKTSSMLGSRSIHFCCTHSGGG
jgi:hypothetical protein